jgi:hypothetical protein
MAFVSSFIPVPEKQLCRAMFRAPDAQGVAA